MHDMHDWVYREENHNKSWLVEAKAEESSGGGGGGGSSGGGGGGGGGRHSPCISAVHIICRTFYLLPVYSVRSREIFVDGHRYGAVFRSKGTHLQ